MKKTKLTCGLKKAWVVCVSLAASTVGCAAILPSKTNTAPVAADLTPATNRSVQAIRQEPTEVDGQTSWIIEPNVPRIPKITGTELQLPPHIEQRLGRAFDLAQRGATYSANTEFREVLGLCALELDARNRTTNHRASLRQGLIALDEADEISGHRIDWADAADVRLATAGHSTPVLHAGVPDGIDAIQVAQLYYSFAEERFAYACEGMPAASLAYYGLARTFVQPSARYMHAAGKAAMLQRVALRISPQNMLAANELGVLLAQHGHLHEAESLFKQCVAIDATPEAWQNLAVIYERKGNADASRAAMAAGNELAASQRAARPIVANAANGTLAAANSPNSQTIAQPEAAEVSETSNHSNPLESERKGLWEKLELSQKLPKVFRR